MKRTIQGGVYLVVDPSLGLEYLTPKIKQAIAGGIDVLQIWNNWTNTGEKEFIVNAICAIAHAHHIPVLINDDWKLLLTTSLDGVHFDVLPHDFNNIKQKIKRPFICGITCGNNLDKIAWATENRVDYISFCSMFPSPSAGVCEIVSKATVKQARALTQLPIFLAGGITLNNLDELNNTGMNGIALISAIMKAEDVETTTTAFKQKLQSIKTINNETIVHR